MTATARLAGVASGKRSPIASGILGRRRLVFFCRTRRPELLRLLEFYRADLDILGRLGFDVRIETRLRRGMLAGGDVCLCWWWHSSIPVVAVWRARGRPVFVTGATDLRYPHLPWARRTVGRVLTWLCAQLATRCLAISDFELADLARWRLDRATRIYPAVDCGFYVPGERAARPTGVMVVQVNPESVQRKGVEAALRSVRRVRELVPDYEFHLVGPVVPAGREWLRAMESAGNLRGVTVHGEVDRETKRRLLQAAWVYVQPSLYEGFGLAVAEAMACGTPSVYFGGGSLPEVVGEAGVRIARRSVAELSDAIVCLVQDREKREGLGRQARRRSADFDSARRERQLGSLLASVGAVPPAWSAGTAS